MIRTALAAVSIFGIALTGCGGDDGSSPASAAPPPATPAPTPAPAPAPAPAPSPAPNPAPAPAPPPPQSSTIPEGLYAGQTSTGRSIIGIVLDDGTYYVLYSATADRTIIAGVVQGIGVASNGSFTSSNGRDINLEGLGVLSANVSASFSPLASLQGSMFYPSLNQSLSFTSTYDRQYELTPSLAALAGTYTGRAGSPLGAESGTITVSTSGAVTGRGHSGCAFSGSVAPRKSGNAYNASITFGGAPCLYPNATFTGGAYFDGPTKRLYAVALRATRDAGFIFSGTKP